MAHETKNKIKQITITVFITTCFSCVLLFTGPIFLPSCSWATRLLDRTWVLLGNETQLRFEFSSRLNIEWEGLGYQRLYISGLSFGVPALQSIKSGYSKKKQHKWQSILVSFSRLKLQMILSSDKGSVSHIKPSLICSQC